MNHKKILKDKSGVNMIETLVIVTTLSTIMVILMTLFITHLRLMSITTAITELQNEKTVLSRILSRNIHIAGKMLDTYNYNSTIYNASETTLMLNIPSLDINGLAIAETYDTMIIYIDDTDGYLKSILDPNITSYRPAHNGKILSKNIKQLYFTYNNSITSNSTYIIANIQLAQVSYGKERVVTLNSLISMKNYEKI